MKTPGIVLQERLHKIKKKVFAVCCCITLFLDFDLQKEFVYINMAGRL